MNIISISFTRTYHLCVLVIINIHTFSCLLISWVFIMFIGNIRYYACKIPLSRKKYYQSHIKPLLNHHATKINDIGL